MDTYKNETGIPRSKDGTAIDQATVHVARYRRFDALFEEIASDWADRAVTDDRWVDRGKFATTESQPFLVEMEHGSLRGVAKPGIKTRDDVSRAAHEKIASDLAYELGLPVPPVILNDRGPSESKRPRHVAISLRWPFEQAFTWNEVESVLTTDEKAHVARVVSALIAFDSLVSACDRKPAHLLINVVEPEKQTHVAAIDYAYSMSYKWKTERAPDGEAQPSVQLLRFQEAIADIARRVSALDQDHIAKIVGRIPSTFLSDERRHIIEQNLKTRCERIDAILGIETRKEAG